MLLPKKASIDAPGVLHQIKEFMAKLKKICPEVTRRMLQQDLTNRVEFSKGGCSTIELRAGQTVSQHGTEKSEIYEKTVRICL